MTPADVAFADQLDAATAEADRMFTAAARTINGTSRHEHPTGPAAAIIRRLEHAVIGGPLTYCPHIAEHAPMPLVWCAWRPGRLRCGRCAADASRAIRGTVEDRRCDHCRRVRRAIHPVYMQLPALVWPTERRFLGPVAVMAGLCPTCHALAEPPREVAP